MSRRTRRGTASGVSFPLLCRVQGIPAPIVEFRFALHCGRQFRFDYAWPPQRLALEIDGGAFTGGRHVRPLGFLRDLEKMNLATLEHWRVLRCTPAQVIDGTAIDLVKRALAQGPPCVTS